MCGRFASWADQHTILKHYGLQDGPDVQPGYNICPSMNILLVRLSDDEKVLDGFKWGFVAHWEKDKKKPRSNARGETVATNGLFRYAFNHHRCLVPVNGYYEWDEKATPKQPYIFHRPGYELFSLAGIWSYWECEGDSLYSFSLITTEPNEFTSAVHDRMPVIINPEDYDAWLNEPREDLLRPYQGILEAAPVSTRVNSPKNQGADLIQPL